MTRWRSAAALRWAEATDVDAVASVPRRTRLQQAMSSGLEATIYSLHGRTMVMQLQGSAGPMLTPQITQLAEQMGITN